MPLTPGTRLGFYEVLSPLGSGGMGEVYRAHDTRLRRDVAIKLLPEKLASSPDRLVRFEREARAVAALNHPNIVTVHTIEEAEGVRFLVMELVEGRDLSTMVTPGGLPLAMVLDIAIPLADALVAAHERHIVHRDLKPANVMLMHDGRVKVLDFGVAKLIEIGGDLELTRAATAVAPISEVGQAIGTAAYMAPEQIRGEEVDTRADLFSFGILVYEMATGKRPFPGQSAADITSAILRDSAPSLTEVRTDLPADLSRIVERCLEKSPRERFQTALDVANELRGLRRTLERGSPSKPTTDMADVATIAIERRSAKRAGMWISIAAALVVLLAGALTYQSKRPKLPSRTAVHQTAIVVLPFANLSSDKDQEYFSDGLSEELLNVLSRNPKLRVTSRTSAFSFKGKAVDIKTIADKLHVTHVLEGSVRKAGSRLRITAQLIDVASDSHLWSQSYDRQMENIFAIQEDIATSVAGALKAALEGNPARTANQTTPAAYNAYLQGRYFYERRTKADFEKAIDYYQQALRIDPHYARAWVGLSDVHSFQADWGYLPVPKGYAMARREVQEALALDPNLAVAHAQVGWIKMTNDWNWDGADSAYKRALELEPANPRVIQSAAWLAGTLGHNDEALALCRRATELDPLLIAAYNNLGVQAYYAGGWDEARAAFRKVLAMDPQYPDVHTHLGCMHLLRSEPEAALAEFQKESEDWRRLYGRAMAFHGAGKRKEADAAQGEFVRKYGDVGAFQVAEICAYRGETDRAFEWLERAFHQRDSGLSGIKGDPLLGNIEQDLRFRRFLQKMELPLD